MSTKRGRRNGKWHKEKSNRRLQAKRDDLYKQSCVAEYIPLEKPVFAGWDLSIGLTESGSRRRDSEEIQRILNILNLSREMFTRSEKYVRHIRNNNHSIESIRNYYQHRGYYIDHFSNRHITYHEYNNLPIDLKKYFFADRYYKYSFHGQTYYAVNQSFPWYECKVVITKSYHSFRRVYDNIAQSEHTKLDGDLYIIDRKTYGNRWRDDFTKSNKNALKASLKKIVSNQYTPEEIDINYSEIFRGVDKRKDYGWD